MFVTLYSPTPRKIVVCAFEALFMTEHVSIMRVTLISSACFGNIKCALSAAKGCR
jgi:hypothetical protein